MKRTTLALILGGVLMLAACAAVVGPWGPGEAVYTPDTYYPYPYYWSSYPYYYYPYYRHAQGYFYYPYPRPYGRPFGGHGGGTFPGRRGG